MEVPGQSTLSQNSVNRTRFPRKKRKRDFLDEFVDLEQHMDDQYSLLDDIYASLVYTNDYDVICILCVNLVK